MPNWCSNSLGIRGDNIQEVLDFIKGDEPDANDMNLIDFNKIIPMPKSLDIVAGSSTDWAVMVINYDKGIVSDKLKEYLAYKWVGELGITTVEGAVEHLRSKLSEDELREGQQALDNFEKYGAMTWYDWCIENWGTKWNACDSSEGGISSGEAWINFDTAWSPPCPVALALSQKFPDKEIILQYSEPGMGFQGVFRCANGEVLQDDCTDFSWEEDEEVSD